MLESFEDGVDGSLTVHHDEPLWFAVSEHEVAFSHPAVEIQFFGLETTQRIPRLGVSPSGPFETQLHRKVEQHGDVRPGNLQERSNVVGQFHPDSPCIALVGQSRIMVAITQYEEVLVKRRFDHLLEMLVPVGQIKKQFRQRFSGRSLAMQKNPAKLVAEPGPTRFEGVPKRQVPAPEEFAETLHLQRLARPLRSLECDEFSWLNCAVRHGPAYGTTKVLRAKQAHRVY